MISSSDRRKAIKLIEEAKKAGARERAACEELGINQRTLQRWQDSKTPLEDQRPISKRPVPKNKLSQAETDTILKLANSNEFKSLPPSQIVPALADKGIYIASESTIYRVLKENGQQNHRGRSKRPESKPISTHSATGPNQVWMWDITWLKGPIRGEYFYLYLILDLFSRKIVGWEIWPEESAENASKLVERAVLAEGVRRSNTPLVLHSDNGSPMKGATLLTTLYELGIQPSRSRPRVSNDNPYAESIFRTCKYRPAYPEKGFSDLQEAREWVLKFVHWYNHYHKHSGINFVTPVERHDGTYKQVLNNRQYVYEKAREAHPERWSGKTRDWSAEDEVWLNPEKEQKPISNASSF
jgi:putative transposase